MAKRAARICSKPGCPEIISGAARLCATHQAEEYKRQDATRKTSARRGYGQRWRVIRARFLRQHPICMRCSYHPATVAHHIIRKAAGGSDSEDNLLALCKSCHSEVHARSGEYFGGDDSHDGEGASKSLSQTRFKTARVT